MPTEKQIREVAERFGLEVYKRITTGNDHAHFATFELTGPAERIRAARPCLDIPKDFGGIVRTSNRIHPDFGKPYVEVQSVWCEVE